MICLRAFSSMVYEMEIDNSSESFFILPFRCLRVMLAGKFHRKTCLAKILLTKFCSICSSPPLLFYFHCRSVPSSESHHISVFIILLLLPSGSSFPFSKIFIHIFFHLPKCVCQKLNEFSLLIFHIQLWLTYFLTFNFWVSSNTRGICLHHPRCAPFQGNFSFTHVHMENAASKENFPNNFHKNPFLWHVDKTFYLILSTACNEFYGYRSHAYVMMFHHVFCMLRKLGDAIISIFRQLHIAPCHEILEKISTSKKIIMWVILDVTHRNFWGIFMMGKSPKKIFTFNKIKLKIFFVPVNFFDE